MDLPPLSLQGPGLRGPRRAMPERYVYSPPVVGAPPSVSSVWMSLGSSCRRAVPVDVPTG